MITGRPIEFECEIVFTDPALVQFVRDVEFVRQLEELAGLAEQLVRRCQRAAERADSIEFGWQDTGGEG